MAADAFISRLEAVRQTRPGHWIARCPAHGDKSPSLAIRELDDGRLLAHCFAGCEIDEVLSAIGLTISDLYPDSPIGHARPERRPFPLSDVMRALSLECDLTVIYAAKMGRGEDLSGADRDRLLLAAERINQAMAGAGV
jgi:hypothetical protein